MTTTPISNRLPELHRLTNLADHWWNEATNATTQRDRDRALSILRSLDTSDWQDLTAGIQALLATELPEIPEPTPEPDFLMVPIAAIQWELAGYGSSLLEELTGDSPDFVYDRLGEVEGELLGGITDDDDDYPDNVGNAGDQEQFAGTQLRYQVVITDESEPVRQVWQVLNPGKCCGCGSALEANHPAKHTPLCERCVIDINDAMQDRKDEAFYGGGDDDEEA